MKHPVLCALLGVLLLTPALSVAEPPLLSAHARWSVDRTRPGEQIALSLVIRIADGFHINADAAQLGAHTAFRPYPTRVEILERFPAVVTGPPHYPPAHAITVGFTAQPLAVFDGRVAVALPIEVPRDAAAGTLTIRLALHYQGCDATSCWMPETITLLAELPITDAGPPAE